MRKNDFLQAFALLGERVEVPVHLVLTGGSALILAGHVDRHTADVDVIHAKPKLSSIRNAVESVAEKIGVQGDWLNDSARAWCDLLPVDFQTRTQRIGEFGLLAVDILGRKDLILLKLRRVGRVTSTTCRTCSRQLTRLRSLRPNWTTWPRVFQIAPYGFSCTSSRVSQVINGTARHAEDNGKDGVVNDDRYGKA